jgi:hypothetical protein
MVLRDIFTALKDQLEVGGNLFLIFRGVLLEALLFLFYASYGAEHIQGTIRHF